MQVSETSTQNDTVFLTVFLSYSQGKPKMSERCTSHTNLYIRAPWTLSRLDVAGSGVRDYGRIASITPTESNVSVENSVAQRAYHGKRSQQKLKMKQS